MVDDIPRRDLIKRACSGFAVIALAPKSTMRQTPSPALGVPPPAGRDDTQALRAALDECARTGKALTLENRAYYHSENIVSRGVSIFGSGNASALVALVPDKSSLIIRGRGVTLQSFQKTSPHARMRKAGSNGIVFDQARDFAIRNVTIDGAMGAGLVVHGGNRGWIGPNVVVKNTKADGVHLTRGAQNVQVDGVTCQDTGDDTFAVVSYRAQGVLCSNIVFSKCRSIDSASRGFAVVGGRAVQIRDVVVERSGAAALYFYGEASYDTYGVQECQARDSLLIDCVNRLRGYSVITIGGRSGVDSINGRSLMRGCSDLIVERCTVDGIGSYANHVSSIGRFARDCRVRDIAVKRSSGFKGTRFVDQSVSS
jgi:hypothetical protein